MDWKGVALLAVSSLAASAFSVPTSEPRWDRYTSRSVSIPRGRSCFPALGFNPPTAPNVPLSDWWCSDTTEQGFMGFSYDITQCQPKSQLQADFKRMRSEFNARYVRIYSACDNAGYTDDIVSSAYSAGLGVYALIWFGFDGTSQWIGRRDALINVVKTNPLAPYVIRSIDVGSEPLFDYVLSPADLAAQVNYVKNLVQVYGIKVAISEMEYGYVERGGAQVVLDAIDVIHAHNLPFFDGDATTGSQAWPSVFNSTSWFAQHTGHGKKIMFTQTGWPTNTNVWKPNSPSAVASVASSQQYANLLDSKCEALKTLAGHGGVGWFWQIWADSTLDGWGILDLNNNPKWNFAPRTAC